MNNPLNNNDAKLYSLQLRLVNDVTENATGHRVEMTALPEESGEPHLAHFEPWESLSNRLVTVLSSTPFHLKVIQRTLHAGLTASVIDRVTGARQVFSLNQLKELGMAS
jgi:hypothetical protein